MLEKPKEYLSNFCYFKQIKFQDPRKSNNFFCNLLEKTEQISCIGLARSTRHAGAVSLGLFTFGHRLNSTGRGRLRTSECAIPIIKS